LLPILPSAGLAYEFWNGEMGTLTYFHL